MIMPHLPKGNRPTLSTKARATVVKEKARAFEGIDKSNAKIYSSRQWRKLRHLVLSKQPLCVMCRKKGRYTTANTVDHILPINKGGAVWNPDNLQSLCSSCHNRKSATDK
jgi:5-methylcytosine-specific restriction endonuclease McrA